MQSADLVTPTRVERRDDIASRKRALEQLAAMLAPATPDLTAAEILDALRARERLGSTALGAGAAIPRARISGLAAPIGAFLLLDRRVDYVSGEPESRPVDLMFALIYPETAADEVRLFIDALSTQLVDGTLGDQLRAARDSRALFEALCALDAPA